jgi:predicted transcriptional regulator
MGSWACAFSHVERCLPTCHEPDLPYPEGHGSPFHTRAGSATCADRHQRRTEPERLVRDAALRLLQEDARFRAAVREGIARADRGEFIEEDEMNIRLEQMLRS